SPARRTVTSPSAVRRRGMALGPGAAGGEYMVADLADRVVQVPESFCDAQFGHVAGQVDGSLQADADMEKAVDDPVEQFLATMCLLGDSGPGEVGEVVAPPGLGDIPDHGEGEGAGRGRPRAEADLDREGGSVLAQPDEPRPGTQRPGPGRLQVGGAMVAVGRPQVGWDEGFDRVADQFGVLIAEHFF